jgi:hypothetical protein
MMASGWTDEDSRAAAEKIIKRAEISKVMTFLSRFEESFIIFQFGRRVVFIDGYIFFFFRVFLNNMLIIDHSTIKITFITCSRENSRSCVSWFRVPG